MYGDGDARADFDHDPTRPTISKLSEERVGIFLPESVQGAALVSPDYALRLGRELIRLVEILDVHRGQVIEEFTKPRGPGS